jgi:hypothetical protein
MRTHEPAENAATTAKPCKLRHVVLFKFTDETTDAQIATIEAAFEELPEKIPEIQEFEWGPNNSPEGLDKGFTN